MRARPHHPTASWRRPLAVFLPLAMVLSFGAGTAVAQEGALVSFDFEDGIDGWAVPDDGFVNVGDPFHADEQAVSGDHSLGVPVSFPAGEDWSQAGAQYWFDEPFSASGTATFQVYAPIEGLQARFQFNAPWTEPTSLRPLSLGWNEIVYDIEADFPVPVTSVNEVFLFVVAQNLPESFDGNLYFDDVAFTMGDPVAPEPPGDDIVFDFDEGVAGWFAPEWLESNAGQPFQDDAQVHSGNFSMALPVHYAAGDGWQQSGVVYRFPDAPVSLLGYESVSFHVYAPVDDLWADFVFNDPWNPPAELRPLELGWNELVFDLTTGSADWPDGVASANEFILRVVGRGLTEAYQDLIWFDDVSFNPGTAPVVAMISPQRDDIVSTPSPDEPYEIMAQASAAGARDLVSVTWATPTQSGALSPAGGGIWTGEWDLWAEPEGVIQLRVTATDEEGESTTTLVPLLVRNSELTVEITQPAFDEALAGTVEVVATVIEDPRFALAEVVLYGLENDFGDACEPTQDHCAEVALTETSPDTWTATLDTTTLADGVESLAVEARDQRFAVRDLAHVIIDNEPAVWDYVGVEGTSFVHDGEPFRYAGWNEYELFTPVEHFGRNQEFELGSTIFGEVLLPGAPRQWEDNVDRQMLEAARHGQTVLRTWGFSRNEDGSAFQLMVDGELVYQEETFQRLDYILDSARRHGIRVIIALDNYWEDYGGINRAAQWLGLENKLQFFTDPAAIELYQDYAEHMITRVNTVNGVPYKADPTVFAWELMNEPRTDCAADPTEDHQFCDPTGEVMRQWMSDQATFIKNLAPNHLVSPGGEAHGFIPTPGGGIQFGGADEGNNNIPFFDMDVPEVDFFTFHPYPNAWWAGLDKQQTYDLVVSSARIGVQRGKPVVMEEWGLDRSQVLYTDDGVPLEPGDPGYEAERIDHYRMMLAACYLNGCAGNNVWMFADWADRELNVNLYRPGPDAERDAPIVADLANWSRLLATGQAPEIVTPGCEVSYTIHGQWPGGPRGQDGGFNAQIWITNTGASPIHGWELGWWFEGGQEIDRSWGVAATQDGPLVTGINLHWNSTIRPGQSLTFGFIGERGPTNPEPPVFFLNGEVCMTA